MLTTNAYSPDGIKPEVPTDSKAEADYRPLHNMGNNARGSESDPTRWADSPLTPSPEYPFCWVVTRKATVTQYGP